MGSSSVPRPLASPTYTGRSQSRRPRPSSIVVNITLASRRRKWMSRASRSGIGLKVNLLFLSPNCSDASPFGLTATRGRRELYLHIPMWLGFARSNFSILHASLSTIPCHISKTKLGIIQNLKSRRRQLSRLSSARIVTSRHNQQHPAGATGSGALERLGSSRQPPRKSHMQADAPPRRSAHPTTPPGGIPTHAPVPPPKPFLPF
jgi:hypothetical protein